MKTFFLGLIVLFMGDKGILGYLFVVWVELAIQLPLFLFIFLELALKDVFRRERNLSALGLFDSFDFGVNRYFIFGQTIRLLGPGIRAFKSPKNASELDPLLVLINHLVLLVSEPLIRS